MRDFLESNGDLVICMVTGALLAVPIVGWAPVFGIAAAVATSIAISRRI
jgi:hypothetical protein